MSVTLFGYNTSYSAKFIVARESEVGSWTIRDNLLMFWVDRGCFVLIQMRAGGLYVCPAFFGRDDYMRNSSKLDKDIEMWLAQPSVNKWMKLNSENVYVFSDCMLEKHSSKIKYPKDAIFLKEDFSWEIRN